MLALTIQATSACAASTMTEVTQANLDRQPFVFEVSPEDKEGGMIWYHIVVTPRTKKSAWCVSAAVRIVKDGEAVGSFELAERPRITVDGSWAFAFSVSQMYVNDSHFIFYDAECEMPAFDAFWFDLGEFYRSEREEMIE
jgi:hypothetical protein